MRIQILGSVRLHMQAPVDLGATKVRGLLGYLAYRANDLVHVDRIAETLWDDDAPPNVGKTLQTYVSRLRRALRSASCPAELIHDHRSYLLRVDTASIDYHQFTALVRNAYRRLGGGQYTEAAAMFSAALDIWTGSPLVDLDTSGARRLRTTLVDRDLIPAHCALSEARLALGDPELVLTNLAPLLADHPHDDRLATQWVGALAAADKTGAVSTFFREFTERLGADLDAKPSRELVLAVEEARNPRGSPAPTTRTAEFPRDTPYFTGRGDLLSQLDSLLGADQRAVDVVALDGPPGVGKTELAKHWVRRRQLQFPDGALLVDLAGYSDAPPVEPHAVITFFLHELGVTPAHIPADTREGAALLRGMVANRRLILVLDNARNSNHVRPLLTALADCPMLITSRQQLTSLTVRDGVQRLSVPPLPPEEALSLLAKRISRRTADDLAAADQLVELCHGLPLALRVVGEHVAARPAVPIDELADELRQTRRLLDAGADGDDHTTTLRSTFAMSYRALPAREQRLFRLLGLHPTARFTVPAARVLGGFDTVDETEELLDALVGAHLVNQERGGRFSCHDLLHLYARMTVRDEEPPDAQRSAILHLFDWYVVTAIEARSRVVGDDQRIPPLDSTADVEPAEFATGNDALQWLVEQRECLVACAYRASQLGHHDHVWRLAGCLNALNRYEDPHGLLAIHELGRQSALQSQNARAAGGCANNMGATYARLGDARAMGCFDMAHELFYNAGDERGLLVVLHNRGSLLINLGRPAEAIGFLTEALAMSTRNSSEWAIANNHRKLGDAYRMLDRLTEARSHYRQSWYSAQQCDDPAGRAQSLSRLAELSLDEEAIDDAIAYGQAAVDEFDRIRIDKVGMAAALRSLATAYLRRNNYPTAVALAREAVRTCHEGRHTTGEIDGLILLGHVLAGSGEPEAAASTWTTAKALIESPIDPRKSAIHSLIDQATENATLPQPRNSTQTGQAAPTEDRLPKTFNEVPR